MSSTKGEVIRTLKVDKKIKFVCFKLILYSIMLFGTLTVWYKWSTDNKFSEKLGNVFYIFFIRTLLGTIFTQLSKFNVKLKSKIYSLYII